MTYLYDTFLHLWQSLFGPNLTEQSIVELLAVVSVIGVVGWILRVIGGLPIFRRGRAK